MKYLIITGLIILTGCQTKKTYYQKQFDSLHVEFKKSQHNFDSLWVIYSGCPDSLKYYYFNEAKKANAECIRIKDEMVKVAFR